MATDITPKKRPAALRKWVWTRRTVQTLFLILFLYLLVATVQSVAGRFLTDLFFYLDPLVGITSMLGGRVWLAPMALGAVTLLLAVIIGRAWCGWVCPLGTVLDWTPSRRPLKNPVISPRWSQARYLLFFAVILGAVLGSLALDVLDPITLFFRTLASVVLPGLNWAIGGVESWLYNFGTLRPAVSWVDSALRGWLLNDQPFYLPNIVLLLFFAVILGLNAVRSRFWCRYLCPLGGLLALVAKVSFIRHRVDADKCISCGKCAKICPTGAIDPEKAFTAAVSECTDCMSCVDSCPTQAISFGRKIRVEQHPDETRRWFLTSLGAAAVLAVFLRFIPTATQKAASSVRPPGSNADTLYNKCIRCGECMRVCPTGVLQPQPTAGDTRLWTPVLKTRLGYCDYSCNACGAICPTGAITGLTLETKRKTVIGVASIDRTRCITWAEGRDCIVCEEMCPVPEKAIKLSGGGQGRGQGGARHPQVVAELCIGCGICEQQCPIAGEAAIRVYPLSDVTY
jgi:MauM/NapG family ferredoxin protein